MVPGRFGTCGTKMPRQGALRVLLKFGFLVCRSSGQVCLFNHSFLLLLVRHLLLLAMHLFLVASCYRFAFSINFPVEDSHWSL